MQVHIKKTFLLLLIKSTVCFPMHHNNTLIPQNNITFSYHHGYLFPHHRLVTYFTSEYINGFNVTLSRYIPQLNLKNPPEMGGGYYFSNLGSKEIYGYVHGIYYYIGREFFRNKSPISFQTTISFGASYNTKRWDLTENYYNRNIGSHFNILFIYRINLKARINRNWQISTGPAIVHTSNGNLRQPNFGLNLLNTHLSLTYSFDQGKSQKIPLEMSDEKYEKNRYLFIVSGGYRQLSHKIPDFFMVGSILTDYSRRINPNLALGLGADLIFDPTVGKELYVTGSPAIKTNPWHFGIHLTYERIWNKTSLFINSGYKIITPTTPTDYQYNRIGIRYRFDNDLIINYSLKSHRFAADFIEFGIGYEF